MRNAKYRMPNRGRRGLVAMLCVFSALHCGFGIGVHDVFAQQPNFLTGFSEAVGPPSSLKPEQLKDVSFKQRLNERLPLDASFKDEYGRPVTLGKYFGGKRPVILAFVYYQCPMLCQQVMRGISVVAARASVHGGRGLRCGPHQLRSA